MTTDTTKPLAEFSWSLNSNTGLSSSGSQNDITPEMYGAIMGVLAGRLPEAEIARLQAQVDALAVALRPVLEHARHVNDTGGPSGEGWQSERLIAQIAAADAALATVGR